MISAHIQLLSICALWACCWGISHSSIWNIATMWKLTKSIIMFGFLCVFVQRFDAVIEALEKGQAVDLSGLPPSPGEGKERGWNMAYGNKQEESKF